jgi:cytidyltransferase-like protein
MYIAIGCLIGVFDMIHVGHVRLIQRASKLCDDLVVIVVKDEAVRKQKGDDRPIIPWEQRVEMVAALAGVQAVVASDEFDPKQAIQEYEMRFSNNISYWFRGEDQDHIPLDYINSRGIEIIQIDRTPDISTSEIARKLKC